MKYHEAAEIIKTVAKHAIDTSTIPAVDIADAAVLAVEALRTPETPWPCWIRTADCRPCAEDASHTGMVLAYKASLNAVTVVKWGYCTPKAYPYWMPYPSPPEQEVQA